MLLTVKVASPELMSVTMPMSVVPTCWLPKFRLLGESVTVAGIVVFVPIPLRLTACGLPVALLVMLTAPVRAPIAAGVNTMLIVQEAPAASVAGKLVGQLPPERAKSPPTVMLLRFRLVLPGFVSEMLWVVLVVPTR